MLLRFAKIAGGLRLLVAEMAPIVAASSAILTARTVVYLVGFARGTIGISLWPIIDSVNFPTLRYAAVVMYNTGVPIMVIAGLVKTWKLVKR